MRQNVETSRIQSKPGTSKTKQLSQTPKIVGARQQRARPARGGQQAHERAPHGPRNNDSVRLKEFIGGQKLDKHKQAQAWISATTALAESPENGGWMHDHGGRQIPLRSDARECGVVEGYAGPAILVSYQISAPGGLRQQEGVVVQVVLLIQLARDTKGCVV
jgi:hypothetical protein